MRMQVYKFPEPSGLRDSGFIASNPEQAKELYNQAKGRRWEGDIQRVPDMVFFNITPGPISFEKP